MSDIFDLESVVDSDIDEKLTKRRALIFRQNKEKLSEKDYNKLLKLNSEINNLAYINLTKDPLYNKFLDLISKEINLDKLTSKELKNYNELFQKIKTKLK